MSGPAPLLEVEDLSVAFDTEDGPVTVVDRVGFRLDAGETLGLVGESGCGKSVTALAIMGLLPKPAGRVIGGRVMFDGDNLADVPTGQLRRIRGNRIAMIFQEPMTALNPVQRIGRQLAEGVRACTRAGLSAPPTCRPPGAQALLEQVGIPAPRAAALERISASSFPAACASG